MSFYLHADVLAKARKLGEEMAHDPVIKPHVTEVAQYGAYFRFRLAHRAYHEQTTHFEQRYLERMFNLADREAGLRKMPRRNAIDDWDRWYYQLVHPIKATGWQIWERRMNLERRYMEALLASGAAGRSAVHKLADQPQPDNDPVAVEIPHSEGILSVFGNAVSSVAGALRLPWPSAALGRG